MDFGDFGRICVQENFIKRLLKDLLSNCTGILKVASWALQTKRWQLKPSTAVKIGEYMMDLR